MSTLERKRLAQELHDGIAQDLVAVGYSLDLLLAASATPIETRIQLRTLRFSVTELINKVRIEIHHLHQVDDADLDFQIREMAERICPDVALIFSMEEFPLPSDTEVKYQVGRIAQEVLRNIAAHSHASAVQISLRRDGSSLQLEISDDGIGGVADTPAHFGIQSIQSRADGVRGVVTFHSHPSGTRMNLTVPIP